MDDLERIINEITDEDVAEYISLNNIPYYKVGDKVVIMADESEHGEDIGATIVISNIWSAVNTVAFYNNYGIPRFCGIHEIRPYDRNN